MNGLQNPGKPWINQAKWIQWSSPGSTGKYVNKPRWWVAGVSARCGMGSDNQPLCHGNDPLIHVICGPESCTQHLTVVDTWRANPMFVYVCYLHPCDIRKSLFYHGQFVYWLSYLPLLIGLPRAHLFLFVECFGVCREGARHSLDH